LRCRIDASFPNTSGAWVAVGVGVGVGVEVREASELDLSLGVDVGVGVGVDVARADECNWDRDWELEKCKAAAGLPFKVNVVLLAIEASRVATC